MIEISKEFRDAMVSHAMRDLPNEACGLLAGRDGKVERLYPMRNADSSPVSYRLDPKEQLRAFEEMEDKDLDLVGIYHSHTHTEAYPSETDRRLAFYPDAHYVLVSLSDPVGAIVRGFTIRDGRVEEQEVIVR